MARVPVRTASSPVSSAGAPFSKLSSASRSDQVRDQLEAAIRRGDYGAGDRLPSERELTEMLGVSRVSVREGIRSLEAVGLVEVRHGHGCFVVDPADRPGRDLSRWLDLHRDEALELLLVRGALDEVAADQAARNADPAALEHLRAAHGAFLEEVARKPAPDLDRLTERDIAFHVAVARASGSDLLLNLLGELHEHLAEARRVGFEPRGRARRAATEHAEVVDAIERGDPEAARRAVATHIAQVRDVLGRRLPR